MNHEIHNLHPEFKEPSDIRVCIEHWDQKTMVTHKSGEDCPLCVAEGRVRELEGYIEWCAHRVNLPTYNKFMEQSNDESL
jgi:hypothetical protein